MHDPELLSLRAELAVCSARVAELLEAIGDGAAGALTPAAAGACADAMAAQRAGDATALDAALARLAELIGGARGETKAWREIGRWFDLLRRLQLAECRRLEAMQAYIAVEEFHGLIATLSRIVTDEISDRDQLSRIVQRIRTEVLNRAPLPGDAQLVHQGASETAS